MIYDDNRDANLDGNPGEHDLSLPALRERMDTENGGTSEAVPQVQADEMGHASGSEDGQTEKVVQLGTIYILETEDKTLIKIGYSTRLTMRLEQHRRLVESQMACSVRLIGFFPGTLQLEAAIHRMFAEHRIHTEWYDRTAVLQAVQMLGRRRIRIPSPKYTASISTDMNARRNEVLSPERRKAIARKAAVTRWAAVKKAAKKAGAK